MRGWRSTITTGCPTRSISYYNKGNLLGVLLDLQVREAQTDTASLRDVFLWMNQNTRRRDNSFPTRRACGRPPKRSATPTWEGFFRSMLQARRKFPGTISSGPLDCMWSCRSISVADPGFVASRNFDAAPVVAAVTAGSEAERAGLAGRRRHSGNQWSGRELRFRAATG